MHVSPGACVVDCLRSSRCGCRLAAAAVMPLCGLWWPVLMGLAFFDTSMLPAVRLQVALLADLLHTGCMLHEPTAFS